MNKAIEILKKVAKAELIRVSLIPGRVRNGAFKECTIREGEPLDKPSDLAYFFQKSITGTAPLEHYNPNWWANAPMYGIRFKKSELSQADLENLDDPKRGLFVINSKKQNHVVFTVCSHWRYEYNNKANWMPEVFPLQRTKAPSTPIGRGYGTTDKEIYVSKLGIRIRPVFKVDENGVSHASYVKL